MTKPASELAFKKDYPSFPEFEKYSIDLSKVEAKLVLVLQHLRSMSRCAIIPSPVKGAWSRESGSITSRHYAVGRLSDAGDVFPIRETFLHVFFTALQIPEIGGIGIYGDTKGPDTESWPMMHIDLRPNNKKVLWARMTTYFVFGKSKDQDMYYKQVLSTIMENKRRL